MLLASNGLVGVPTALLRFFYAHNHFIDMFFSLLMLGTFTAFLLVSKWYKLRKRIENGTGNMDIQSETCRVCRLYEYFHGRLLK